MNESEFLIYHYSSKNEQWYDATKNVVWFSDDNNAWRVKFKSSDDFYHVSYQKMRIFDNPKEVEFAVLYYKESPCYDVKKLLTCFNNIFNDAVLYKKYFNSSLNY